MSDGEDKGGWWGSWVKSAKDKSLSAINMVKRDLAEFSSVMHEDTIKAASKVKEKLSQENANAATEKVKQGVSNLLGGISKALVIEPDDNYQPAQIVGGEAIVFDRYKARLHAIQIDPATYTAEPCDERYQQWLSDTNLDDRKGDISELLVSNVEVRALYTQLVPCTVSNLDFWGRYYFKRHLLEEEEARRVELMRRAEDVNEQKDLGWDEDEDDWTEARALSTASETIANPAMNASETEIPEEQEKILTGDQPSSGSNDPKLMEETKVIELLPPPDVNIETNELVILSAENQETFAEVCRKPESEHDSKTISRTETSSSNFSEEIVAPLSDNSMETLAVMTGDIQSLKSTHSSDPSLSGWSALSDVKSVEEDSTKVMPLDNVLVSEPSQNRKTSSDDSTKESLDDEWEKDFDVEVTEEDLQAAQNILKRAELSKPEGTEDGTEDWEDW